MGQVLPLFARADLPRVTAQGFDDFWRQYPRKVARLAAVRAWRRLSAAEQAAALAAIGAHCAAWAGRELEHVPHAATWLNGHRWEDELSAGAVSLSDADLVRFCAQAQRGAA